MRLFRFYLPRLDNTGKSYAGAIEDFRDHLLAAAGGFTDLGTANGKWLDEKGHLHADHLAVIEVGFAKAKTEAEAVEYLNRSIEVAMRLFSDQQAIYAADAGLARIIERVTASTIEGAA